MHIIIYTIYISGTDTTSKRRDIKGKCILCTVLDSRQNLLQSLTRLSCSIGYLKY